LVLLVLIVSKSSFLPLSLLVAFLATAADLRFGGVWWGDVRRGLRYEVHAGIASLTDDLREIRAQAESAPSRLQALWEDATGNFIVIETDLTVDTRIAAGRIATLIKTS
jgi:hypothetical protein